jgi:hypothetical protein
VNPKIYLFFTVQALYIRASVSTVSIIGGLPQPEKKLENLKTFHKFQNARQARTGRNMVKSSSPNMSSI